MGHLTAARKGNVTPNNTETIERIMCHCFLRPIRRDLTSISYTTEKTHHAGHVHNSLIYRRHWIEQMKIHREFLKINLTVIFRHQ